MHAAIIGMVERKLRWLQERGVSLRNPAIATNNLASLQQYIEKEQIKSIPMDELKTTWCDFDQGIVQNIKEMIASGADSTIRDKYGRTAFHYAALFGMMDVVSLLLDGGADVNAVDKYGRTALHRAVEFDMKDVASLLLDGGADVNAVDNEDGKTALHIAARDGKTDVVTLLLDRGADIDAVDKENHSSLVSMIWRVLGWNLDETVAVARLLCSRGSSLNLPASVVKASLEPYKTGLLACAHHWHECYKKGELLTEIPTEVIEGGEDAVRTFLDDLENTTSDELIYRSKVCIVGPIEWGKTSLVKSITENKSSLVDIEDRTIGIDLFPFTFEENSNDGMESKVKRYNVTFWDFAGQDIYHFRRRLGGVPLAAQLMILHCSASAARVWRGGFSEGVHAQEKMHLATSRTGGGFSELRLPPEKLFSSALRLKIFISVVVLGACR